MGLHTPLHKDAAIGNDTPIWRYMDLAKFVSMLSTGGLWFAKAARLHDDPYEGFCKARYDQIASREDGLKAIIREDVTGKTAIPLDQMVKDISRYAANSCENARDHLYVNSWCLAGESMAMWQIYSSLSYGIAVTSSIGQYLRAARFKNIHSSQCRFGKVKYHGDLASSAEIQRDFSELPIPLSSELRKEILALGFHKRACYEHEAEWRAALYQDSRPDIDGVHVVFDLEQLITAVYVSPRAEEFFFEAVSSLMSKFFLQKLLDRSALLSPPRKDTAGSAS
ncbi:MAG: hypothetical protein ABI833_03415 [Acidobacteriota bacterium]